MTESNDRKAPGGLDTDELIQRFVDGEMSPEEARDVRELLSSDEDASREAAAYRRMGDMIRESAGIMGIAGGMEEEWKRTAGRLGQPGMRDRGPGAARVWLSEFASHRKRYWIPAAGAIAAAAAALLIVTSLTEVPVVGVPIEQAADLGSRVTDISLQSASTLVFEVETATGGTAAVLWITGDDENGEGEGAGDASTN